MKKAYVLTVAESKRLIAKGIAKMNLVKNAMEKGLVVVSSGSTNGYIVEELLGEKIDKTGYMTGKTLPAKLNPQDLNIGENIADIVFTDGKLNSKLDRVSAAENFKAGDVFIKGANALNYQNKVAGILIGHPAGGTIAAALGHIIGKRANLIIPIGLEKCISSDIYEIESILNQADVKKAPKMLAVRGHIFTEIEALETLFNVQVKQIAAGGLAGAEGGVWLLVEASEEKLSKVDSFLDEIQGEPPFYH